ncbi:MAG TPA: hypothetical protein VGJ28_18630, partial [Micromonosporaceae bacterium]
MRTAMSGDRRFLTAPVYLERIESLPVGQVEVPEGIREYHQESLIRSIYEGKDTIDEFEWPKQALGVSFFQMAGLALDTLAPDVDFDLVVLASATPDCQITHFSGPRFDEVLPGHPGMIGVGDQGAASPFTAVRLAWNHLRYGLADRAIVLVMEQALLPVTDGSNWAPRDSAVVMVLSRRSGLRLEAASITRGEDRRPLADRDYEDTLLIQGNGVTDLDFVAPRPRFGEIWKADGDYACTGVWDRLADGLPSLNHDRIVLAEVDRPLSYRCALEITRN